MSQTVKFSIEKLSAVCVLSPNNPERKKQFLHLKKNLPQLKAFPAIMGNALSKKDIQSLLKKKILDRWSIYCHHKDKSDVIYRKTNFKRLFLLNKNIV